MGDLPSFTTLDENDEMIATTPLESYLAGVVGHWLEVPAGEVFPGAEPIPIIT